jgi:hypothetical protein
VSRAVLLPGGYLCDQTARVVVGELTGCRVRITEPYRLEVIDDRIFNVVEVALNHVTFTLPEDHLRPECVDAYSVRGLSL